MSYRNDDQPETLSNLPPARARQLQKLAEQVDRLVISDRVFFERFPHREFRLRHSDNAEVEQCDIFRGSKIDLPEGARWWTLVRNFAPGVRLRHFVTGPRNWEPDADEVTAARVFQAIQMGPAK